MTGSLIADVRYGDGVTAVADLHLPPVDQGSAGLAVNLHGGGWYTGDKTLARRCCAELAERGLAVVNANYRILPSDPVPAMVADAMDVLRWVRSGNNLPGQLRDAARSGVTLTGDSAGAHIAALTTAAQLDDDLARLLGVDPSGTAPVTAIVSWSGALALDSLLVDASDPLFNRFSVYITAITENRRVRERIAELDPLRWMSANTPPILAFSSAADFFYRSNLEFARAAAADNRSVTLIEFDSSHPACTHSWQLDPELEESRMTYDRTVEFAMNNRG